MEQNCEVDDDAARVLRYHVTDALTDQMEQIGLLIPRGAGVMSANPFARLLPAFGDVLLRYRNQRQWTVEALASAAGVCVAEVKGLERGD